MSEQRVLGFTFSLCSHMDKEIEASEIRIIAYDRLDLLTLKLHEFPESRREIGRQLLFARAHDSGGRSQCLKVVERGSHNGPHSCTKRSTTRAESWLPSRVGCSLKHG